MGSGFHAAAAASLTALLVPFRLLFENTGFVPFIFPAAAASLTARYVPFSHFFENAVFVPFICVVFFLIHPGIKAQCAVLIKSGMIAELIAVLIFLKKPI